MISESKMIGGPYNGNSFIISPESETYAIASTAAGYAVQHIYTRVNGYEFIYTGTQDAPTVE